MATTRELLIENVFVFLKLVLIKWVFFKYIFLEFFSKNNTFSRIDRNIHTSVKYKICLVITPKQNYWHKYIFQPHSYWDAPWPGCIYKMPRHSLFTLLLNKTKCETFWLCLTPWTISFLSCVWGWLIFRTFHSFRLSVFITRGSAEPVKDFHTLHVRPSSFRLALALDLLLQLGHPTPKFQIFGIPNSSLVCSGCYIFNMLSKLLLTPYFYFYFLH